MNTKRIISLFAVVLLCMVVPFTVSARSFEYEDFTVEIPDNMYIFTPQTSASDESWELAGITNPIEKLEMYTDADSGMNAVANFVSPGGDIDILLTIKASSDSLKLYNLADVSAEEYDKFISELGGEDDTISIVADKYEQAQVPFFSLSIEAKNSNDERIEERIYSTILNGNTIALDTFSVGTEVSGETMEVMASIANSFTVTKIIPPEEAVNTVDSTQTYIAIGLLLIVTLSIIGMVIFTRIQSIRDKKMKKKLADKLSEYRRAHGSSMMDENERMLYANSTDCSIKAIHEFSRYHAYVKNIAPMLVGIILSVVILVVALIFKSEWWLMLIAGALLAYYIYKLVTSANEIEKVQRRVYSRGVSQTAHYAFYSEVFKVSGIQSSQVYPYFQITDIRASEKYIYIYYGPENAYIINKSGFVAGASADEFLSFLKEKKKEQML